MFKKVIKRVIIIATVLILLWIVVLAINIFRCLNYKKPIPIFSIGGGLHDTYNDEYKYIGYTIKTHSYYGKVVKTELNIFDIKLVETDLIKPNRKPENAKLEVLEDSLNKNSITVVITDNNEFPYGWTSSQYEIEKKADDNYNNWRKVKFENEIFVVDTDARNEKNQITLEIDWSKQYEELSTGTYRIVKEVFDESHGYVDIYSNEFEILK